MATEQNKSIIELNLKEILGDADYEKFHLEALENNVDDKWLLLNLAFGMPLPDES